jgi:hypothetical protein
MDYRGIEFTVVQGIERNAWKWSVSVAGAKISGRAFIRSAAVAEAESAIDRTLGVPPTDIRKPRRIQRRASREEVDSLRWALASFALQLDDFESGLKMQREQRQPQSLEADALQANPHSIQPSRR